MQPKPICEFQVALDTHRENGRPLGERVDLNAHHSFYCTIWFVQQETQVWRPTGGSRGPGRGADAERQLVSLTGSMQAELSQPCHRHTPHIQERRGCSAQAGSQLRDSCPILILKGTSSPAAPQMVICLLRGNSNSLSAVFQSCASGGNSVRESSLQPLTGLSK